jgi:hypothetical protein
MGTPENPKKGIHHHIFMKLTEIQTMLMAFVNRRLIKVFKESLAFIPAI